MKKTFILFIIISALSYSCKKIAKVDLPPNQLAEEKVFSDTTSIKAATAGLFTQLGTVDANLVRNASLYTDELKTTATSASNTEFANSSLTVTNSSVLSIWQNLYSTIYKANEMIEGLHNTKAISEDASNSAIGESMFIRGYSYLLLTRIFGDVPLVLSTNAKSNATISKSSSASVLLQSIADFTTAKQLLTTDYPLNNGKTTANKFAALAYLSTACLEAGQYNRADSAATAVIASGKYSLLSDIKGVCTANNDEAILQLFNQIGVSPLNLITTSGIPQNQISETLITSFETGDNRKANWIETIVVAGTPYYFPFKYKQRSASSGANAEYSTYMRLAEVYLNRSEARARIGDIAGSLADINIIRNRAGLPPLALTLKNDLLNAILHERQIELFNENGSRFFDLKRFGLLDQTLSRIKPLWKATGEVFPIPQTEILNDPNLIQNQGY
ncbi:hypothetical protein ABIC45_002974 [Mucilaginibacter rubeus]|uniref:RagB/SusD family nutrient uptake outer membrane protein n=1 Tax=Mucilaginibacter rubeus TaxID=2027860 RepID=UPI003399F45A